MSTYQENLIPIKKLSDAISRWMDEDTCNKYFRHICDEYDKSWKRNIKLNHWQSSKVRILLQVHERLLLTDKLDEDSNNEFIKRYMYPQLIEYLRLTCFDQLGQPSNWMTFDNWLNSKKKAPERQKILCRIQATDKIEFSKLLFKNYQGVYGVKNSFFRFLNEILPLDNRLHLLSKIKYRIQIEAIPTLQIKEASIQDKANYLFSIRNNYTHNTYAKGPIRNSQSEKASDWEFRETLYKGKESHWISTHREFETELRNSVLIGITEIIKMQSSHI